MDDLVSSSKNKQKIQKLAGSKEVNAMKSVVMEDLVTSKDVRVKCYAEIVATLDRPFYISFNTSSLRTLKGRHFTFHLFFGVEQNHREAVFGAFQKEVEFGSDYL